MPSTAALHLLRSLAQSGAGVSFHADFDWPGLRIGNVVCAQVAARPWRFTARDYEAALSGLRASDAVSLRGAAVRAAWDEGLAAAMRHGDRAVFEEHVIDRLVTDLQAG
jgi:uncharacterized protein (TIGR02679 family)